MTTFRKQTEPDIKIVSLRRLIEELLNCYSRSRKDHQRVFINDIPRTLAVPATKNILSNLLSDLLAIISSNPGKKCLRISAAMSEGQIKLQMNPAVITGYRAPGRISFHKAL